MRPPRLPVTTLVAPMALALGALGVGCSTTSEAIGPTTTAPGGFATPAASEVPDLGEPVAEIVDGEATCSTTLTATINPYEPIPEQTLSVSTPRGLDRSCPLLLGAAAGGLDAGGSLGEGDDRSAVTVAGIRMSCTGRLARTDGDSAITCRTVPDGDDVEIALGEASGDDPTP